MGLWMDFRRSSVVDDGLTDCASPDRAPVIALHCSGADGNQWRKLSAALGPGFDLRTPSFIGCADVGHWRGEHAFTLLDDARAIVDLVDSAPRSVHLIGHSYGGGVALKVASLRPDRIASLALYEPSAFHLLRQLGARAAGELAEIEGLAAAVSAGLVSGAYCEAAETFVDYWSGRGAWSNLRPEIRAAMLRWLPKASLDFRALLNDDTPLASYRRLLCPVLVLRGEQAPGPSRLIAEELACQAPGGFLDAIPGAGHMGPVTHAAAVLDRLVAHIRTSERELARMPVDSVAA